MKLISKTVIAAASLAFIATVAVASAQVTQSGKAGPATSQDQNTPAPARIIMRPSAGELLFDVAVDDDLGLTAGQRNMPDSLTIYASLTKEQKTRLTQICMQLEGNLLLGDPDMQTRLGFSGEQDQRMLDIQGKLMADMNALRSSDMAKRGQPDMAKGRALRQASTAAMSAVLTESQTKRLHELLGMPFDRSKMKGGVSFGHSPEGHIGDIGPNILRPVVTTLTVDSMAPDFTMLNGNGKQVKLSDYRGKVVVLDFWATWCQPCIESMPAMQELNAQISDTNCVFLSVCVMDDQDWYKKFVKNHSQYTFDFMYDEGSAWHRNAENTGSPSDKHGIPKILQFQGIPTVMVIDRAGKIVFRDSGSNGKVDPGLPATLHAQGILF